MYQSVDHCKELLQLSYENDRTIRAIIRFSGIGEFFRHFVSDRVKEIRVDRSNAFFDELEKHNIELTEEKIKSEDFLHKFHISYEAAIYTRRREKIRMFARLLNSSLIDKSSDNVDAFEDYLKILKELSFREMNALVLLDSFYSTSRNKEESDLAWTEKFWNDFEKELERKIDIPKDKIGDFMSRLSRTGCYELFKGNYPTVDVSKGMGSLTSTFQDLKKITLYKKQETI